MGVGGEGLCYQYGLQSVHPHEGRRQSGLLKAETGEFEASLVYIVSFRAKWRNPVSKEKKGGGGE